MSELTKICSQKVSREENDSHPTHQTWGTIDVSGISDGNATIYN